MDNINLEVKLFLASIVWGIILVVLYDGLRIIRRVIKHNRFIAAIGDIIYWSVSAILIFRMMYRINDGGIRGFAIMGMLLGMVLYHYSVSDFLVYMIAKGIYKGESIIVKVFKFIMKPFIWCFRRSKWFLGFFTKIFHKPAKAGRKSLKKLWKQVKIAVVKK